MTSFKNMLASGLLLATSIGASAQGLQLSENEKAMVAWIDAHQDEAHRAAGEDRQYRQRHHESCRCSCRR